MLILDHLTVAALSVEAGVRHVEQALGVKTPPGGVHPLMGTRNHLMRIGEGLFLEVIAPDPHTPAKRSRWFGLDDPFFLSQLEVSPRLATWVGRVPDIAAALSLIGDKDLEAVVVTRGDLSWRISVSPDGSMPFSGAFPTLIEWPEGQHPSEKMADLGCRLDNFRVSHPAADRIVTGLKTLGLNDKRVEVALGEFSLSATFETPTGLRTLT